MYTYSSVVITPAAKAGGAGFDSWLLPWVFFLFQRWITNVHVDGMKELWCSMQYSLAAINTPH